MRALRHCFLCCSRNPQNLSQSFHLTGVETLLVQESVKIIIIIIMQRLTRHVSVIRMTNRRRKDGIISRIATFTAYAGS